MTPSVRVFKNLTVVGMEAAFAGCDGLDDFERMIYAGTTYSGSPAGEPGGASTEPVVPLLEKAVRGALRDAGMDADSLDERTAVLAACWGSAGLPWDKVMDLSSSANPLVSALIEAERLLASGDIDAVVFAAASGRTQMPAETPRSQSVLPGFDRENHGWRFGYGAGAVVLMQHSRAVKEDRCIYALVQAMADVNTRQPHQTSLPTPPALDDIRECCLAVREAVEIPASQIGYLEAFSSGFDALDAIEIAGTVQAYRQPVQDLTTALGSAQDNVGYLDAASGLAGLIRAALCLHRRIIPGTSRWTAPKLPALWRNAPYYAPNESRTWFEKTTGLGRWAVVNAIGLSGSFAHLLLREEVEQPVRKNHAAARYGIYFFPIAGDDLGELMEGLEMLRQRLALSTSLPALAAEFHESALVKKDALLGAAIVGSTPEEVEREISLAIKALPGAVENGSEWQTPAGSYFTSQPAGPLGSVALVYPGAFNTYPGAGKDLFYIFPRLHQRAAQVTGDMGKVLHERMVYPRSLTAISKEEMAVYETRLLADPIAMLISGTALAILYTHILIEEFGIRPSASFGYSLGENSMMYATGVWMQGDSASARLADSDVFRVRLAGPQQAIRERWGIKDEKDGPDPLWSNYLIMAAPEKVSAALEAEPRVYLTHINTPRQVVIGGDPEGCRRVVSALRCASLQAPFDYALHCSPMQSEYDGLADLHHWPVENHPPLQMYSAADYELIHFDSEEIAGKMAHMLTKPLDFPRLVNRAYDDGARVFIEAGAGSNCARWISETLKGSPHLALSMDRRGSDDYSTIVRTAARLFSHRVKMDISTLFEEKVERLML